MTAGRDAGDSVTGIESTVVPRVTAHGLMRSVPIVAGHLLYIAIALLAVVSSFNWLRFGFAHDALGFDFRGTLWDSGIAIREGRSPYPMPVASDIDMGNPALYPPLLPVLVAPLTVLPWTLGLMVWAVLLGCGLGLALAALDVRDPRCYAIAFISAPAATGLVFGNVTLLLVPLVALSWRWRDRWLGSGVLIGVAIASKLFLWPLVLWLLGTRRYRAAGAAALTAMAGLVIPWALIGFDGLATYPDLLRVASEVYGTHSVSVTTILSGLGAGVDFATYGALVTALVLALLAFFAGRRNADEIAVSFAVLAAIFSSPIVWDYNFALLLVPLGIVFPRFALPWVALLLLSATYMLPRPWLPPSELEPGGTACCPPKGVPEAFWTVIHTPPALWPALGHTALAATAIALIVWVTARRKPVTVI